MSSPVCRTLAILSACILIGQAPSALFAQSAQRLGEYNIKIILTSDKVCTYRIDKPDGTKYPDQDLFKISPHGKITFSAVGTDARIEIGNDSRPDIVATTNRGGLKGIDGDNAVKVKNGKTRMVKARGPKNMRSEHKVAIRCCNSFGLFGFGCSGEAAAKEEAGAMGSRNPEGGVFKFVSASDEEVAVSPAPVPGGPKMDVEP